MTGPNPFPPPNFPGNYRISKSHNERANGLIIKEQSLLVEGPDIVKVAAEFDKRWEVKE